MVLPGVFGLSLLALASALLQLVQTRMMATQTDDPQQRTQQRIFLHPAAVLAHLRLRSCRQACSSTGSRPPSSRIVQQYLINGWGGLFPLFGWTPGFAADHTAAIPGDAAEPTPRPRRRRPTRVAPQRAAKRSATDSAAGTIRPAKGRSSRRGRRR